MESLKTWIATFLLGLLALLPWAVEKSGEETPADPPGVVAGEEPGEEVHGYIDPSG